MLSVFDVPRVHEVLSNLGPTESILIIGGLPSAYRPWVRESPRIKIWYDGERRGDIPQNARLVLRTRFTSHQSVEYVKAHQPDLLVKQKVNTGELRQLLEMYKHVFEKKTASTVVSAQPETTVQPVTLPETTPSTEVTMTIKAPRGTVIPAIRQHSSWIIDERNQGATFKQIGEVLYRKLVEQGLRTTVSSVIQCVTKVYKDSMRTEGAALLKEARALEAAQATQPKTVVKKVRTDDKVRNTDNTPITGVLLDIAQQVEILEKEIRTLRVENSMMKEKLSRVEALLK